MLAICIALYLWGCLLMGSISWLLAWRRAGEFKRILACLTIGSIWPVTMPIFIAFDVVEFVRAEQKREE